LKKNVCKNGAKTPGFVVLLVISLIAFYLSQDWLKWAGLFLAVFSWRYLYKGFSEGMRNKKFAWDLFSLSGLALLSLMLYSAGKHPSLPDLLSGNLVAGIVFCTFFVLAVSAARLFLFPKAMPRHSLEKRKLPHAVISNALGATNEEFWFRWAVLFFLLAAFDAIVAVIACALLFSLMHLDNRKMLGWSFFNGLVFSTAMVLFGSILGPIWGHFLLNMLNRYSWPFK